MEDRKMEMFLAVLLGVIATDAPVVSNPGFEQIREQTGWPEGWASLPEGWHCSSLPSEAHLVRYETKAGEGPESRALLITVASDHPDKQIYYNVTQDVPGIIAGKSYRLSAKVRTRGLRTAPFVCAQCLDSSKSKFVAIVTSPPRELTADIEQWERVETKITVPEGTTALRLRIGVTDDGNEGGTAIIDDIEVIEAE
jgi:hypothetical protein